jgi:hypothetical protein
MQAIVEGQLIRAGWCPPPIAAIAVPHQVMRDIVQRIREMADSTVAAENAAAAQVAIQMRTMQDDVSQHKAASIKLQEDIDRKTCELQQMQRLLTVRQITRFSNLFLQIQCAGCNGALHYQASISMSG